MPEFVKIDRKIIASIVSDQLTYFRWRNKLSQEGFVALCKKKGLNLTIDRLSRYEKGVSCPNRETLEKLAFVMGVCPESLMYQGF